MDLQQSFDRGLACERAGDLVGALAGYSRAHELAPDRVEPLFALARIHRLAGEAPRAVALLRPLAAVRPTDAEVQHQLGRSLFEAGDAAGATAAFEAAVAARPGAVTHWMALAAARVRLGRHEAAIAAADRAVELAPDQPRAHLQRAIAGSWSFEAAGLATAASAAQQALNRDPSLVAAHDVLCIVWRKLGRLADAIAAGQRAVAAAPREPGYAVHLADALLEAGRAAEAVAALTPAVAANPDHPSARRELGVAELRLGDATAAAASLDRAHSLDPFDQRTVAHRIACHQMLGEHAAARALIGVGRFVVEQEVEAAPGFADRAAFHAALEADIRAHPSLRFEPVGLAARGGSLAQDLLSHRTAAIDALEAMLRARIAVYQDGLSPDPGHPFLRAVPRDFVLSIWATLLEGGGEIATHIHEQSWLSGAYYVRVPTTVVAGDSGRAGWFEHGHPGVALPGHAPELGFVRPREGLLVLFPSYLYHRTVPFEARGETRISISFDVTPRGAAPHAAGYR